MIDITALLSKLEGAKTLMMRARKRTIECTSYRGDINLSLETVRDLAVAEELINEVIEYLQQHNTLSRIEPNEGHA